MMYSRASVRAMPSSNVRKTAPDSAASVGPKRATMATQIAPVASSTSGYWSEIRPPPAAASARRNAM